jgi:TPR repeat protein
MSFELESHVRGHGRGYQQGSGNQYNIEAAYFTPPPTLSAFLFSSNPGSLVYESDPLELGVHRATILNGNAVPEYVPRDIDADLSKSVSALAQSGGLLIIVGDSTAGKSRAAYEALLRTVPNYRLIAPYGHDELRDSLAYIAVTAEKVVLWLDDIERFLGSDGFTARLASQLKRIGVLSIGTIRTEQYRSLTAFSSSSVDSKEPHELLAFEDVLKQAKLIFMERRWSATERARATETKDSRVAEALKHDNIYGIAEYLAAGPRLYEEWRLAWEVGENPRGAALVSAAIDCYRTGLRNGVALAILKNTHEYYLNVAGGPLLRPETFDRALSWATQRRYGVTSLLLSGSKPHMYRAFDYLTDKVVTATDAQPVPDVTWQAVRESAGQNKTQLNRIAIAAMGQEKNELAESIWRENAEDGSSTGAYNLGLLFNKTDRDEEAKFWFERAVDLGDLDSAIQLGHLLDRNNQHDKAAVWYERAALGDKPHGMYHMAIISRNKGDEREAERWFRQAIARNDKLASSGLSELLVTSGRLEEAETLLRAAAEEGDVPAIVYLGNVIADLGREDEAEEMWLKAATLGSAPGKSNLAILHARRGSYAESERWFTEAIADGQNTVCGQFSVLLAQRRKWNQSEAMAKKALASGDTGFVVYLGQELLDANRLDDAERWLRMGVDAGNARAVRGLAWTLEQSERSADAEQYWRKLAEEGDSDATFALAMLRFGEGDLDNAIPLFESAAASGDAVAACELSQIYWTKEDDELTEKWLLKSFAGGHIHAACNLGHFYHQQDNPEKAEEYWTHAYNGGGHAHAAGHLATLLAGLGHGHDAAMWLRRADSRGGRSTRRRRQPRKNPRH